MPELLDDIAFQLNSLGIGDITATSTTVPNLHLGMLRDVPHRAIGLIQLPGTMPVELMGGGYPSIERPRLQVFSRHDPEDYVAALALARSIWKALSLIANQTVNGTYYERIQPQDSPAVFDRDDDDRVIFVCNFDVWKAVP